MFYSDKVLKALRIAFAAHTGQFDKAGYPYFLHPYHLAEQMSDEDSVIVALLHDVIEDTAVTMEDLRKEGFSEEILVAVELLTHDKAIPYLEYVAKIRENPLARRVKIADLRHNCDVTRGDNPHFQKKRRECYYPALDMLLQAEGDRREARNDVEDSWGKESIPPFLIQDARLAEEPSSLEKMLEQDGFSMMERDPSADRTSLYVDLKNKTYAFASRPFGPIFGGKAISVDEFTTIYKIFR